MKRFFFTKTASGKTRSLSVAIRRTVNDLVDYEVRKETMSKMEVVVKMIMGVLEKLYHLLMIDRIPIFNPENVLKIWFNSIIVCYNCFYLLVRSLMIFFRADFGQYYTIFHYVAEACWVIEMAVQMNTSMYHNNHFTKDRKLIMKIYLKEYFFFEILPLVFDGMKSEELWLHILFKLPLLLKIKGISIILKNLEFYVLQLLDNHSFFFLFKLILQMVLFGHSMACAFSLVTTYEINSFQEETPWQSQYETSDSWETRYQQSLYWAFTTMMNVQNNTPTSNLELGFTCICMLVSCVAFGYLISSIGGILNDLNKEQQEYKKDLNILNQFMKRKSISIGLVRKANIHLKKFYLQQRRIRFSEENETLMKLNSDIKKELLISANWKVLKQCSFFMNIFSNLTVQKLCTMMTEKLYTPGQVVFDRSIQDIHADYFMYIIINGSVQIEDEFQKNIIKEKKVENKYRFLKSMLEKDKSKKEEDCIGESSHAQDALTIGRRMKQGEYFGIQGFFTNKETIFKAVSQEFSQIMTISKNDFLKIISEDKADFERYNEIQDKIKFSNDYSDLKTKCCSCLSRYHETYQCPKVYFDKDRVYTMLKSNYSFIQERSQIVREGNKSENALKFAQRIERGAFQIQLNYGFESITNPLCDNTSSGSENEVEDFTDQEIVKQRTLGNQAEKPSFDLNLFEDHKYELPQIIESKYEIGNLESYVINQLGQIEEVAAEDDTTIFNNPPNNMENSNSKSLLSPLERSFHNQQNSPFKQRKSVESNLAGHRQSILNVLQPKQEVALLKQLIEGLNKLLGSSHQTRAQLKRKCSQQNILIGDGLAKMHSRIKCVQEEIEPSSNSIILSQNISKQTNHINTNNQGQKGRKNSQMNQISLTHDTEAQQKFKVDDVFDYQHISAPKLPNSYIELDRMQIYSFYYSHQNAPEMIASNNSFLLKQRKRKLKRLRINSSYSRSFSMKSRNKDFPTKSFAQSDNQ